MTNTVPIWLFDQKIKNDPEDGVAAIRKLLEQLERRQWSDKDVFGIHMAMEEAVMNAIKHGNRRDPSKFVAIQLKLTEQEFFAEITDEGEGFNPDDVPDPTTEINLEKFTGRGLMLMRNYVDRVVYNSCGNSVQLFKTRTR